MWLLKGREGVKEPLKIIATEQDARLPVDAYTSLVWRGAGHRLASVAITAENPRAAIPSHVVMTVSRLVMKTTLLNLNFTIRARRSLR